MAIVYSGLLTFDLPDWDERGDGWTPDCQGKWDFDPTLVSFSSRAYPNGAYIFSVYIGEDQIHTSGVMQADSLAAAQADVERLTNEHAEKIAAAVRAIYPPAQQGEVS
jgi:hypothetical protein